MAQAQTPPHTLNQYVSDLQKNPDDYALREKIIKHVQTMKPKPAVSEEAQKYMDRGLAAIEGGKGEADFRAASVVFAKAANLATRGWGMHIGTLPSLRTNPDSTTRR